MCLGTDTVNELSSTTVNLLNEVNETSQLGVSTVQAAEHKMVSYIEQKGV